MINLRACYSVNIQGILFLFTLLLPTISCDNCTCDGNTKEEHNSTAALHYKLGAIASILLSSVAGVCLPLLGKRIPALRPENDIFFVIKAFAAGVILATGFIHILPDSFENLTSACLNQNPWGNFPFAGFFAMLSAIGTLMIDAYATGYYTSMHFDKQANADEERDNEPAGHLHVHTHATHGHAHGHAHGSANIPTERMNLPELTRHRIIAQVLEIGIVFHSVIIGIDMGVSQSVGTIRPLLVALSFHQFFEGIGLGGCISQAKFKTKSAAIMATFFSLTTPVGVAIGIAITSNYNEDKPAALIVQGTFNGLAAGILIYMALVDLLAEDFMNPRVQNNFKIQLWVNVSLLLGAGCMSLLAKWA